MGRRGRVAPVRSKLAAAMMLPVFRAANVVIWNNDDKSFDEKMWNPVAERLAGLAVTEEHRMPPRTNHCRDQSCIFQRLPIPHNAAECAVVASRADVVLVPAQLLNLALQQSSNRRPAAQNRTLGRFVPPRRSPGRPLRVLYWREAYYGSAIGPSVQRQFDLTMGVHFTSSILNPAFFPSERMVSHESAWMRVAVNGKLSDRRSSFRPFTEREGFAMYVASHCGVHPRSEYVSALRKLIDLDEYGGCAEKGASKGRFGSLGEHRNWLDQIAIASHYKFYLSFENTIAPGYVTEKLLQTPILAGTVPVYLGAPNAWTISIDGTHRPWFIDIFDFDTPADLAAYLVALAEDVNAWMDYLRHWRDAPPAAPLHHKYYIMPSPRQDIFEKRFETNNATKRDHRVPEPHLVPTFFLRGAPTPVRDVITDALDTLVDLQAVFASPLDQGNRRLIPSRVAALCRLCDLDGLDSLRRRQPPALVEPPLAASHLGCLFAPNCSCRQGCLKPLNRAAKNLGA